MSNSGAGMTPSNRWGQCVGSQETMYCMCLRCGRGGQASQPSGWQRLSSLSFCAGVREGVLMYPALSWSYHRQLLCFSTASACCLLYYTRTLALLF
ncbi:hypothetical protein FKM82_017547 [Ascaphus truei]